MPGKRLVAEAVSVEAVGRTDGIDDPLAGEARPACCRAGSPPCASTRR